MRIKLRRHQQLVALAQVQDLVGQVPEEDVCVSEADPFVASAQFREQSWPKWLEVAQLPVVLQVDVLCEAHGDVEVVVQSLHQSGGIHRQPNAMAAASNIELTTDEVEGDQGVRRSTAQLSCGRRGQSCECHVPGTGRQFGVGLDGA
eukprot:7296893-Prymnesium_polylepis.1